MKKLEEFIKRFKVVCDKAATSQESQPGICVEKANGQKLWVWVSPKWAKFKPSGHLIGVRYLVTPILGTTTPEFSEAAGTEDDIVELLKALYVIDLNVHRSADNSVGRRAKYEE